MDREFDRSFGVDTAGKIGLSDLDITSINWEYGIDYEPTVPNVFNEAIGGLPIKYEEFTFIDFGSGKGRALLLASEFPFKKIIGVEFSSELHRTAQRNICAYKSETQKCKRLESVFVDATAYLVPPEQTVFYFFNPFEEAVMTKVLANIQESLARHPRRVFIVYRTALFGYLFDRAGFLKKIKATSGYWVYTTTEETMLPR